jgi:hypothetical protein
MMGNPHIHMKTASVLLIVLGLLISGIAATANAVSDTKQTVSAAGQGNVPDLSNMGFDPIIIPQAGFIDPSDAPTLLPQASGLIGSLQISTPAGEIPTLLPLPVNQQAQAAGQSIKPTTTLLPIRIPDRIVIPAITLDAPVILATYKEIVYQEQPYEQLEAPNTFSVGRLMTSAPLGIAGKDRKSVV